MNEIILASQSPRRKKILTDMGVSSFKVVPSDYAEELDESRDEREVAMELALGKARVVADQHPNAVVIASDTIVGIRGRQLEKPKDVNEARSMLFDLSTADSTVTTGVAVLHLAQGIELVDADTTIVHFKPDSDEVHTARETYLASNDWKDKAGGYGIQSGAAPLIESIEGYYDTVVGLPSKLLAGMLGKVGIDAHGITEIAPVPQISDISD